MREGINFNPNYGILTEDCSIKVIGVGGAGGNAVKLMYTEGIKGVDFLICNTDKIALENNPVPNKLILGKSGLGAGANPELACQYATESEDEIKKFIGENTKMLFIAAGMGKGTGTGASHVVARIAKEMGILTIAVVTYPYKWEQKKVAERANFGINKLKEHIDSIIIINNENLLKYYDDDDFDVAYARVDNVLKTAVKCIAELITLNLEQNIDFNDVKSVMTNSGSAMLSVSESNAEDRVEEIFTEAFNCPLLSQEKIFNAKKFLFCISFGPDRPLKMKEFDALTNKFAEVLSEEAEIIWGRTKDETLGDKLKLSIIITDYDNTQDTTPQTTVITEAPTAPIEAEPQTMIDPQIVVGPKTENTDIINQTSPTNTITSPIEQPYTPPYQPELQNTPTNQVEPKHSNIETSPVITYPTQTNLTSPRKNPSTNFDDDLEFLEIIETPAITRNHSKQQESKRENISDNYQLINTNLPDDRSILYGCSLAD